MDAVKHMANVFKEERKALVKLFNFLDDKMNSISESLNSNISLSKYLDDQFHSYIINYDSSCLDSLTKGYEWYCKFLLEINGCHSLSHVSLKLLNNYKECEGDPHVELKNGYSSLINIFLSLISPDRILKNKCVVKIDWSDFKENEKEVEKSECGSAKNYKSIKILCGDGDIFLADHVVITIPLGFLKKHNQTLFIPSLCISKLRAIQDIGFGTVNKIYLQFEEAFWKEPDVFLVFSHHLSSVPGSSLRDKSRIVADSPFCSETLIQPTHHFSNEMLLKEAFSQCKVRYQY